MQRTALIFSLFVATATIGFAQPDSPTQGQAPVQSEEKKVAKKSKAKKPATGQNSRQTGMRNRKAEPASAVPPRPLPGPNDRIDPRRPITPHVEPVDPADPRAPELNPQQPPKPTMAPPASRIQVQVV